jgi:phosphoribosyl 1,2-cyclic phosphodiesterase
MDIQILASGSSGNCYRVSNGVTPILLEAGIPFSRIRKGLEFRVSEVAGVLVSHEHMDHAKAAADMTRAGVDVYASAGTMGALGLAGYRAHQVVARRQFTLGTWIVLPFETEHDAAEPLGFLLSSGGERLLYATDTYYIRYRFQGLTHIMVECNYSADIMAVNMAAGAVPAELKKRLIRSHFSLENVKKMLKSNDLSKVQEIYLVHLSDGNSDAARFKREIQELTGKMVFIA